MAVRLKADGKVHHYSVQSGKTYCGAPVTDEDEKFKGGRTECEACDKESGRRFLAGWDEWERKNPQKAAAANREAERAGL